jgi:hypothetical protein
MLVLLAAATVAAAVAPPVAERTPNLYRVPAACKDAPYHVVDRHGRPLPARLGDLPKAGPMLLVDRKVDGCPVITMMRGATTVAPDQPNPPSSQYRVVPVRPSAKDR